MLPPMLSYAQNGEDVVLRRAFADVESGFYVDVGACVPVADSVTAHFYEHGWRGVNVEPDPAFHAELVAARPRDVNVQAAVGDGDGLLVFYPTSVRGQGTVDSALAAERGGALPVRVPQVRLADLLSEHAPPEGVDFLKVDVEGFERQVLASHDWRNVRPRVVVVEAVDAEGRPSHEGWESALLEVGYDLGLFDGLNRFYVAHEHAERLLPLLAAPANVLDSYQRYAEVAERDALRQQLAAVREQNDGLQAALLSRDEELEQARAEAEETARGAASAARQAERVRQAALTEIARLQDRVRALEIELVHERTAREADRATVLQVRQEVLAGAEQVAALQRELAGLHASTSWRLTSPVRDASRLAKVLRKGGPRP